MMTTALKRSLTLIALLTLTACGEGEFRIAPPVPYRPAPRPTTTAPPLGQSEMLNDPEREEWTTDEESILADSPEEANRKCQQLAAARGLDLQSVRPPSRKGGKMYVCKFGGYVER